MRVVIWLLGVLVMSRIFFAPAETYTAEDVIDDRYIEETPLLHPGDTLSQTFSPSLENLEGFAITFSYEEADDAQVLVRIFRGDELTVEQPLPLSACPNGDPLWLNPGISDFSADPLTVQVTNVSETDTAFCLLATSEETRFSSWTAGYEVNGVRADASIFCRFRYTAEETSGLYVRLTKMFLVFLACLILTGLIRRSWQPQHTPHSPG